MPRVSATSISCAHTHAAMPTGCAAGPCGRHRGPQAWSQQQVLFSAHGLHPNKNKPRRVVCVRPSMHGVCMRGTTRALCVLPSVHCLHDCGCVHVCVHVCAPVCTLVLSELKRDAHGVSVFTDDT